MMGLAAELWWVYMVFLETGGETVHNQGRQFYKQKKNKKGDGKRDYNKLGVSNSN